MSRLPHAQKLLRFLAGVLLVGLGPVIVLVVLAVITPLPAGLQAPPNEQSIRIEARSGELLREARTVGGALTLSTPHTEFPTFLLRALVAAEDKRFYHHVGVDPLATLRAAWQWARTGSVVSGASTLTMQLARTLRPHPRTLLGKIGEAALALRLESSLSKAEILEQYLNRVDFGPNLRGVSAAARAYFGREPKDLSEAELALLAGLPQAPSAYALIKNPTLATHRRQHVLAAMIANAELTAERAAQLETEPLYLSRKSPAFGAPHLASSLLLGRFNPVQVGLLPSLPIGTRRVRTTIDPLLQRAAEAAVTSNLEELRAHNVSTAAVLLVDNASGDVLAYVGSRDFYAPAAGQVDGVLAQRQPGSTLKPFVYAAAFEELGYTPATVLADTELRVPTAQGEYTPRNYDERYRGPIRLREALANSINVPAVRTALALGPPTVLRYLHAFGFDSLTQSPEYYGPAIALGDGEVSLLELVRAYAALARGGISLPLRVISATETVADPSQPFSSAEQHYETQPGARLLAFAQAAELTDILKDPIARSGSFGRASALEFEFDVAVKTGTSKGYRDNWAVGFTDRYTLGVWVGNSDGSPMREVGGATGAAPIFRAVLLAATAQHAPKKLPFSNIDSGSLPDSDSGVQRLDICPLSGLRRGTACPRAVSEWLPAGAQLSECTWHQTIWVDRRNQLLASASCAARDVESRVFEVYPPEYQAWARTTHRPVKPTAYSPNCPPDASALQASDSAPLRIIAPLDGEHFVLDPDRPRGLQRLAIQVVASSTTEPVTLLINDDSPALLPADLQYDWQLSSGTHTFIAKTRNATSNAVQIHVR